MLLFSFPISFISRKMWCSSYHGRGTKKNSEFPTGFEPLTFRTPVGCYNHWATRDLWRATCSLHLGSLWLSAATIITGCPYKVGVRKAGFDCTSKELPGKEIRDNTCDTVVSHFYIVCRTLVQYFPLFCPEPQQNWLPQKAKQSSTVLRWKLPLETCGKRVLAN